MSWRASEWAKQQRLGSAAAKSILMCLSDYADPKGVINGWCSQAQLADDAEVSERSVREWMQRLQQWGLLKRSRRNGPSGARAVDVIHLNLDLTITDGAARLRGAAKAGDENDLPAESAGRSNRQPGADLPADGDSPTGTQFRAYKESPPLSSQSPPIEREARAREGEDDAGASFRRAMKVHPRFKGSVKGPAMAEWSRLTPDERAEAEARMPALVALWKRQKRAHPPEVVTVIRERLWSDVEPEVEPQLVRAPAFGPVWGAIRMAELLQPPELTERPTAFIQMLIDKGGAAGEREKREWIRRNGWRRVNALHAAAERGIGEALGPGDRELAGRAGDLMEPVPVGSAVYADWEAEHERRGWPWLPDPGRQAVVFFPKGGPAGLAAFEEAIGGNAKEAAE